MSTKTLFDKLWDSHVIEHLGGAQYLLHVDRHLLHDGSGPGALRDLGRRGLPVHNPELTFATPDHFASSAPGRDDNSTRHGARLIPKLRELCARNDITNFDLNDEGFGIVHVIGPESGLTLPGLMIVCGDSHTCTHGAFGALAFGIGSSEVMHVLATQTLVANRPQTMRIKLNGSLPKGCYSKDIALALIAKLGTGAGSGFAIEYAGDTISELSMESRLTLCNLTVELGAKTGVIAPDKTTLDWCASRLPGEHLAALSNACDELVSDADAVFDIEHEFDVFKLAPQITWGTSPEHSIDVARSTPDPADAPDAQTTKAWQEALEYQGLKQSSPIMGTPIDHVFIGSCTNSRLSDLRAAAAIARQGKVDKDVEAWVVPGSMAVLRAAEAEGLDEIFKAAGFQWRLPGCSRCVAMNGEIVAPGKRCISTSNRNFVGRQGPGARTHLASPATAAACALSGAIADPREYGVSE